MKLKRKMFLCGDMLWVHKCDMCERESDGDNYDQGEAISAWPGHLYWKKRDFTLCLFCLLELAKKHIDRYHLENFIDELKNKDKKNKSTDKTPIPATLRWQVWERDNFTCQNKTCGSRKNLTVDHIIPESKGGKTKVSNLQTLCKKCNSRKGIKID